MNNQGLRNIIKHAEERVYDYMINEGTMPAMALIVNDEGLFILPMPTKNDADLRTKAAILRKTKKEVNADIVVYITEASLKASHNAKKKNCIIIAGASEGEKLIKTLPFTRKGKDIVFEAENPATITTAIPFRHPVIDTM